MLVDSHCHLDFPDLCGDLPGVLERARVAGVGQMLTISTRLSSFPAVRAIAEQYDHIWCSLGVHPHDAAEEGASATPARLVELAVHPKVIGIGETGLDFYYEHSARGLQEQAFRNHIAAARELQLPIIVHTRDADDRTAQILREELNNGHFSGLIHCFTSSQQFADFAIEFGFYISFSGILTFKKADELRSIAARVPVGRILVETDAPYLAPVPHRGCSNEPAYVAHTAAELARIRGVSLEEITAATTENFHRLFTRVPGS